MAAFRMSCVSAQLIIVACLVAFQVPPIVSVASWVNVGTTTSMQCAPTSPNSLRLLQWRNSSFDVTDYRMSDILIDFTPTPTQNVLNMDPAHYAFIKDDPSYPLTINTVTLDDEARYWCVVNSAIDGERHGSFDVRVRVPINTSFVEFVLNATRQRTVPSIVSGSSWVDVGMTTTLQCAPTSPNSLRLLQWRKSHLDVTDYRMSDILIDFTPTPTHTVLNRDPAHYAFSKDDPSYPLTINTVALDDEARYWCVVNSVTDGERDGSFDVRVKVTPLPPENVSVDQGTVTATSVTITWRPGIDVGEPKWFYFNIRKVDTTTWFDPNTRVRIDDCVVMHVIDGLYPYTKYEIEVYAENAYGVSPNVRRTATTLPDTPEKLDISVTTNQENGIISVDGIPQDGDTSSCLRLETRLTNQDDWFHYGECLETNTDLALREARSRYCYGDLCSQATTAKTVAGQSRNAGLIAGIVILAIVSIISITLNAAIIMYYKRRGPKRGNSSQKTKEVSPTKHWNTKTWTIPYKSWP